MDSEHATSHSANQRSPLAKASGATSKSTATSSRGLGASSKAIEIPNKGTGSPSKGSPISGRGTPMSGKGSPMSGKGSPMSGKGTPMSGKGTPMSGKGTPMSGKGTPSPNKGAPLPSKESPVFSKGAPILSKGAGMTGKATWAVAKSTGAVAKSTGAVTKSTGAVAKSTGAVAKSTGAVAKSTGAVAKSTELWPNLLSSVAKSTGAVAKSTGAVSKSTGAVSKSTGAVSKSTGAVSKSTGAVSKSTGAVRKSTGAVRKSTGAVSKSTGAISKATGSISKATGSISKAPGAVNRAAGAMTKLSLTDGSRMKGVQIVKPIIYGNVAWYLGSKRDNDGHTHQWKVYLKAYNNEDLSVYIKRVHFKLHDSYKEPNRICFFPPFGVTETGWGEFEITMKIFFQDSNERPVVIYHFLKLFDREKDGNVRVMSAPVHSEFYDEMIFTDPTAKMYRLLSHPRVNPHGSPSHRINYENKKVTDLQKVIDAKHKVRKEIAELKDRLSTAKDSIQLLKSQVFKVVFLNAGPIGKGRGGDKEFRHPVPSLSTNFVQLLMLCMRELRSKLLQIKDYDLPYAAELLKSCKDFFKDLRSDTAFNEMLCDASELAKETDIPTNFELPKPRHRVRVSEY
ncbi:YEATS domain-containing protein 4 [Trichonephila clavipes]|nr:YEATS domain-containing protein 4 [Trichonephila clavipes]